MRRRFLIPVFGIAVVAAGWVWWQQGGFGGPVSDGAARRYFARIVAAAQAHDFLNGSVRTCQEELRVYCPERFQGDATSGPRFPSGEELARECRESVPTEPPAIVASRHRPSREGTVGGRLLVVTGTDGRGKPYETDVLIFRDKRSFKATHAVFWSGAKFEESGDAGAPPGTIGLPAQHPALRK